MENYFNYFTEIEEHFHRRRGTTLLLSTLDWALIETWKDAGIPLEAVLRGIDSAFDRYERRPSKSRKINGLAYCSQEVLSAAEDMKEAAVGVAAASDSNEATGIGSSDLVAFVSSNANALDELLGGASPANRVHLPANDGTGHPAIGRKSSTKPLPAASHNIIRETARTLRDLAAGLADNRNLQDVERRLTILEEKLFAVLLASTPDDELVGLRAEAERALAPYRRKMPGMQIEQLQKQFVHKRLLERYGLPRLSLFYMTP